MSSKPLQTITYNGHETYLADDLKQFFPSLFKGLRSVKEIVIKHNIPGYQYFVVKVVKGSYKESDLTYLRSKILIKTEFIDALVLRNVITQRLNEILEREKQMVQLALALLYVPFGLLSRLLSRLLTVPFHLWNKWST
ncbi:BRO-like protein [carnivorous sponge associated iridovirus]|nr:BRO-like protein [carnivorous sponge associated iridovirus]